MVAAAVMLLVAHEVAELERRLEEVRQREQELRAVDQRAAFHQAAERYAAVVAAATARCRAYLVQVQRVAASCAADGEGDRRAESPFAAMIRDEADRCAASQAKAGGYAKQLDGALALQEAAEQARASLQQRQEAQRSLLERAEHLAVQLEKAWEEMRASPPVPRPRRREVVVGTPAVEPLTSLAAWSSPAVLVLAALGLLLWWLGLLRLSGVLVGGAVLLPAAAGAGVPPWLVVLVAVLLGVRLLQALLALFGGWDGGHPLLGMLVVAIARRWWSCITRAD